MNTSNAQIGDELEEIAYVSNPIVLDVTDPIYIKEDCGRMRTRDASVKRGDFKKESGHVGLGDQ
jgi:hypothetical protein